MAKRILIIEDEMEIAELERDFLEVSGYDVVIKSNGNDGLAEVINNDFDLVIVDIMLPGIDGFEICRNIRREKNTPVMFVSAKQDDIDKIRGLGLGADDYMVKPFNPQELVARVGAHIARFERISGDNQVQTDEIIIRDLKLSQSMRQVKLHDKELYLPNREFELLLYLAKNPGKALRKATILNYVWGVDAFVEDSTVAVHVNRLREKIEKDPSNPTYIETVWGIGYKFKI